MGGDCHISTAESDIEGCIYNEINNSPFAER